MSELVSLRERELSVLGALILHGDLAQDFFGIARPRDFQMFPRLATLLDTLLAENIEIDYLSVKARADGCATDLDDALAQAQRTEVYASSGTIQQWAETIHREGMRWRAEKILIDAAREMRTRADYAEIVGHVIDGLLAERGGQNEFASMRDIALAHCESYVARFEEPTATWGVPTGFADMDKALGGLEPASVYLIAARPSMGKTALVLALANNIANARTPVAFFSLEMSAKQLLTRLVCLRGGFNSYDVRRGLENDRAWTKERREKFFEEYDAVSALPLFVNEQAGITTAEAQMQLAEIVRQHKVGVAFFDYINLAGDAGENRNSELERVMNGLKRTAKRYNIPVIACAQLNRKVESREVKEPMLSDLRDSGAIEQVANAVIFLHRKDYYGRYEVGYKPDGLCKCILAKNQNGAVGHWWLKFNEVFARFEEAK